MGLFWALMQIFVKYGVLCLNTCLIEFQDDWSVKWQMKMMLGGKEKKFGCKLCQRLKGIEEQKSWRIQSWRKNFQCKFCTGRRSGHRRARRYGDRRMKPRNPAEKNTVLSATF